MGKKRTIRIKEDAEELSLYKKRVSDYKSSQRLDCLLLIKEEKYETLEQVATHLGVHPATMYRWLKEYRDHGIKKLLAPRRREKASQIISATVHNELEQKLSAKEPAFSSYVEIQEWLLSEHDINIKYSWLWKYLTTKMDTVLKVPRKSNIKKEPGAEQAFLKTAPTLTID